MVKFSSLEALTGGRVIHFFKDRIVETLVLDSRKAISSEGAVFFAIAGVRHDGHRYLKDLHSAGFRQFVVEEDDDFSALSESNVLRVESSITALQALAAAHRAKFDIPIIGITGSNGKTIIKEWLFQLLSPDLRVVKNPGSYNSQTGVPLSVWQLDRHHELGIFEAGISKPGEMIHLQQIIRPTIGIMTNAGGAHDEGFRNRIQKIREKLILFSSAEVIIYCKDHVQLAAELEAGATSSHLLLSWGFAPASDIRISLAGTGRYQFRWGETNALIEFPFSDAASVENACHCIAVMFWLKYPEALIQERVLKLLTIPMRLELKQGINGCQIIDDTYNNDLAGLQISLDFLAGMQKKKTIVILSDILQSGLAEADLAKGVEGILAGAKVSELIGIGPMMRAQQEIFKTLPATEFFISTEDFLSNMDPSKFAQAVILIKGARRFRFERIVQKLVRKIHGTIMEIDLGAMVHNLNFFKSRLGPDVKVMAMVKAFAYGSGSEEIAGLLQYHGIDFLGVAYADEGVELRKNKIRVPVMVMNPTEESFNPIIGNNLEPEIYNLRLLKSFATFLNGRPHTIHLKIDTGMRRLGFEADEIPEALHILSDHRNIRVASIFSHLAGADEPIHDDFTRDQIRKFLIVVNTIKDELRIDPILHVLNSSGILRFPEYQFGMVRLGIGLYGINPANPDDASLKSVVTLKTIISQIKKIPAGETVGYGRHGKAGREMKVATIAIGYADGFSRAFSGGKGEVLILGRRAPVVGNVCMDMTMVDITDIPANEGDEVIIFGEHLPIRELAEKINTIPYEILTGTSERVKRIFFAESI